MEARQRLLGLLWLSLLGLLLWLLLLWLLLVRGFAGGETAAMTMAAEEEEEEACEGEAWSAELPAAEVRGQVSFALPPSSELSSRLGATATFQVSSLGQVGMDTAAAKPPLPPPPLPNAAALPALPALPAAAAASSRSARLTSDAYARWM